MTGLYPEIEPYEHGMLEVGDGNLLYWATCGNPRGKAAVVLHGGPGSGCTEWHRRLFDPTIYRMVLLDQRSCGRSTPHASAPDTDLASNNTAKLIKDIELLRQHLHVDQWLVFGGSWGSTLALRRQWYPPMPTSNGDWRSVSHYRSVDSSLLPRSRPVRRWKKSAGTR